MQDTGAAVTDDVAKAKGMTACTPARRPGRTVGAVCADESAIATARTVSAGVIFCGKEGGTPYNLRGWAVGIGLGPSTTLETL